jgi:molybdopterin molybdotransferase
MSILSFQEVRRVVLQHAAEALRRPPAQTENVSLLRAAGRVLAGAVLADRDLPPFPRAARDGYALRAADLARLPARLHVVGSVRAGSDPAPLRVQPGEAVEIMTGAAVPAGADAVIMVEHTKPAGEGAIEAARAAAAGDNIVPAASEARLGDVLLPRGTRLDYRHVAAAAAVGATELAVFARPRVAILATGDELVDAAAAPGPVEIRNSNSYSLAAQVTAAGGEPVLLPIAPDEDSALARLLEQGLGADLLLIAGGVSAGRFDRVEPVLARFAAEFFFTGALIQPGKPIVFGRARRRPQAAPVFFFGLPGNPVSTMVTFELFARPLLESLGGAPPAPLSFVQARLKSEVSVRPGLTRFLPAVLAGEGAAAEVERIAWQGSGDLASTARANCYLVVPPERDHLAAGETVSLLLR